MGIRCPHDAARTPPTSSLTGRGVCIPFQERESHEEAVRRRRSVQPGDARGSSPARRTPYGSRRRSRVLGRERGRECRRERRHLRCGDDSRKSLSRKPSQLPPLCASSPAVYPTRVSISASIARGIRWSASPAWYSRDLATVSSRRSCHSRIPCSARAAPMTRAASLSTGTAR
jgi:hypothetical protein